MTRAALRTIEGEEVLLASPGTSGSGFKPSSYDQAAHTVDVVMTTGQRVARWYGYLELATNPEAIDLSRVNAGKVHLLDSHNTDSIRHIAGNVIGVRFDGGVPIAKVRFADTELGRLAEGMVARGELTGTSPGIHIHERQKIGEQDDMPVYRATRWMPHELSLTSVPADGTAGTLSVRPSPGHPQEKAMDNFTSPHLEACRANDALLAAATGEARDLLKAERFRTKQIKDRCRIAKLPDIFADRLIESGCSLEHACNLMIDELAATASQPARLPGHNISVGVDHTDPSAIEERMATAMAAKATAKLPKEFRIEMTDDARQFAGMTLLQIGAEFERANGRRIDVRQSPAALYEKLAMSTSDFPLILANAANKIMLPAYQLAEPTYLKFFAPKTFKDFKEHNFLRIGDFPDLLATGEMGEIKEGTLSESDQKITAATYGRRIGVSRRILINDDQAAFAEIPSMAGRRCAAFVNTLAFKQFAINSNNGPTITEGGVATNLWDAATHVNYTSSGTAISVASIGVGWAAIQVQKSLDGMVINITPRYLLTAPAQGTLARQYCSPSFSPNQPSSINPYGGLLEPLTDANLSGTAWYLFADPAVAQTFVYGYLEGQQGPRFAVRQGFETEGIDFKVALDIGVGAVDFRGTYKNAGA